MKLKLLIITLFISLYAVNAQNLTSKRIRINNPTKSIITNLQKAGIDLRCGAVFNSNSIVLDLGTSEIKSLNKAEIPYVVEIDDLTKFYSERSAKDLPFAQAELAYEKVKNKLQKKSSNSSKSATSISSVVLDNYLQYYGEQEVDWVTPSNFIYGSMGGCLTVSEMEAQLDLMRTKFPGLITVKQDASTSGKKTYGLAGSGGWPGQIVYYVKISHDSSNPNNLGIIDDTNKPDILYTSMIHSRELISLMGNIYYMWYLLENYATNPAIKNLVDNNELFFVPIVNPDGLKWNEKEDPSGGGMNRTNLRGFSTSDPTNNSNYLENYGVDPNRNFNYLWGSAGDSSGSSGSYSSSTFRGPSAFSEPESQIMRDFILSKNFKTAVWMHSYANGIPHPYGGIPTKVSGREDEMAKWHEDMTRYNRYVYGAQVLSPANGIADDWMLGGTSDSNGSVGSGMNILATTPENGANDGSEDGFWPSIGKIIPIAKRMIRIQLVNAYYGGKYAKFHDLTQSDISTLSSNLTFGIERVGQTDTNFTLTVTPVSSNIQSITSPVTQTGMAKLEQRNVTAALVLNAGIQPNEKIEYKIALSNNDYTFYEVNIEKYYQPTILFADDPDADISMANWVESTNWINSNTGFWSGTRAIKAGVAVPYANNINNTITTTNAFDLSGSSKVLVQFYSKWDLERNFDFVEIEGYNGSAWVKLNGKYNKPESSSFTNSARSSYNNSKNSNLNAQAASSGLVYDGNQMDNWVLEEILIDASNNSSLLNVADAKFRFNFRTDGNNIGDVNYSSTYDGFYFDDFKVIGIQIPCAINVPTGLNASTITATSATIGWDNVPSANYDLKYRVVGESTWIDILDITTTSSALSGLSPSSNYEVQVRSKCSASNMSAYSASTTFSTTAVNYCASSGNASASDEYIGQVQLGAINNSSGNEKYADFTAISTDLTISSSATITITPTWTSSVYSEGYSVWIDYNKNGDFSDAGEQVWTKTASQSTPVSGSFTIPTSATLGTTRMRVSLKYNGVPTSCETMQYGEVEDYSINIIDSTLGVEDEILNAFKIYPNPVNNNLVKISLPNTIQKAAITISNALGQKVYISIVKDIYKVQTINTNNFKTGIYFVTVNSDKGKATKKLIIR